MAARTRFIDDLHSRSFMCDDRSEFPQSRLVPTTEARSSVRAITLVIDLVPENLITYWRVRTAADAAAAPEWDQLDGIPSTTAGLHGELKIENDDQIMVVYFVDEAAQEPVTRAARDAASLAQEWQIPHTPAHRSRP